MKRRVLGILNGGGEPPPGGVHSGVAGGRGLEGQWDEELWSEYGKFLIEVRGAEVVRGWGICSVKQCTCGVLGRAGADK